MVFRLLTHRQGEAVLLACAGLTPPVVAAAMGISERVARSHLQEARRRLGTHAIADVCRMIETGEAPPAILTRRGVSQPTEPPK